MIRTYLSESIKEMRLAAAELTKAAAGLEKLVHFAGNAAGNSVPVKASLGKTSRIQTLEELERRAMQQALEQTDGNQSEAARLLGVGRDQFRYRMAKYKLTNRPGRR
jgi:DNA-binding NtrC family response regulator